MSLATARLATEKAVIRPALPLVHLPGIAEMQMKQTYFEKLKDPRWQKKRLECLDAAGWSCEMCGDDESTLHVHHKQYFKGREPWDYERGQLAVLCEACHSAQHESEDELQVIASFAPIVGPLDRFAVAYLLSGVIEKPLSAEAAQHHFNQLPHFVGAVAGNLASCILNRDHISKRVQGIDPLEAAAVMAGAFFAHYGISQRPEDADLSALAEI